MSSSEANLWITPSGDSAEAIQFDKKLVQNSAFVEFGMHGMDSGDGEHSKSLAHHAYPRRARATVEGPWLVLFFDFDHQMGCGPDLANPHLYFDLDTPTNT